MNTLTLLLFGISVILLILNVLGLRKKLILDTIPKVNLEAKIFGRTHEIKNIKELARLEHEDEKIYFLRLFNLISEHLIHYQPPNEDPIPLNINWILYLLKLTNIKYFKFYELYHGRRAIRKGYGLCSQIAITIWFFLRKSNIKCSIVRLDGHVINQIYFKSGEVWVIDGDYRAIIPHPISFIQQHPELINQYYTFSDENKILLTTIYQKKIKTFPTYKIIARLYVENNLFLLKWLLPISYAFFYYFVIK